MKALLIDGMNLVRRVHAAVPGDEGTLEHFEGALESTLNSLRRALNEHEPTHAVCAFDAGGRTWRHEIFPDYKLDRLPMPEQLRLNLHRVVAAIENLGVRCLSVPGVEADDVLATIAVKTAARDGRVVILSTDKSMCQLAGDRIRIRDHFAARELDVAYIEDKFGVAPSQLACLLGLMGDKSLNVPGVKSIGARTAAKLINEYGTLENMLANAETIPGRPGKALIAEAAQARLSVALVRLKTDVSIGINLSQLRWRSS
ncbi:MAG: 5'-3' exonuclease [Gammaproteobacteria bacterium]|nr:5'-3' exonuclease [Gammaproteobacteria bacterium]